MYLARAKRERGLRIPLRDRFIDYLYEHAWIPAIRESPLVARELVKAMQMLEISSFSLRLRMIVHVLRIWVLSWFRRDKPPPALPGPPRTELLQSLAAVDGDAAQE
jgi:hypothetical protein